MGRQLQKKKAKSSIPKIKLRKRNPRKLDIKGNAIIAANWDKTKTLSQNYAKLGLTSRLNASTWCAPASAVSIADSRSALPAIGTAQLTRDADGNITGVRTLTAEEALEATAEGDVQPVEATTEVVRRLEESTKWGVKKERTQSEREEQWCQRLVEKHGEEYGRMFRDRKLNPMQQSEGDIRRRVGKWRKKGGTAVV